MFPPRFKITDCDLERRNSLVSLYQCVLLGADLRPCARFGSPPRDSGDDRASARVDICIMGEAVFA
jgi:hypothetical protein